MMKDQRFQLPLGFVSLFLMVSSVVGYLFLDPKEPNARYFTNLSNLFMGFCSLILLISLMRKRIPKWVVLLQLIGTNNLFLTMMTVILFLAPTSAKAGGSFLFFFEGPMLFYHLLNPLTAVLSFMFLLRVCRIQFAETLLALFPVAAYGAIYTPMVLTGRWPDFYGFTFGGRTALIPVVLLIMGAAAFAFALILRSVHNHFVVEE